MRPFTPLKSPPALPPLPEAPGLEEASQGHQGESVSKPRWFYVREPSELELSQDATVAAKAAQANGQQCNQSDAEVIELRQAAERSRASAVTGSRPDR